MASKGSFSRRRFLELGALAAGSALVGRRSAFASAPVEMEVSSFTPQAALDLADGFLSGFEEGEGLIARQAIAMCDAAGGALGYVVSLTDGENPHGYIVFDATDESLISQFSFAEGAVDPFTALASANDEVETLSLEDCPVVVSPEPFQYALYDEATHELYGMSGSIGASEAIDSRSVAISNWSDIFVRIFDNLNNYSFGTMGGLPYFIAYSESQVKNASGRYACAISAMLCGVEYYAKQSLDIATEYLDLWSRSSTSSYGFDSGGHMLGSTSNGNIGPAMVSNLAAKGVSVTYSNISSPNYWTFTNCLNRGDFAIFACGINTSSGRDGHAMAVEGYATVLDKAANKTLEMLMVCDGWNATPAYVNLNFANYTDTYGITFSS